MPCEICDGTTWKTITTDGVSRVTRCDCWHQQLYEGLLKSARIPRRYLHCELTNFETHTDSQRTAHRKALKLVDEFPVGDRGLLFHGEATRAKNIFRAVSTGTPSRRSFQFCVLRFAFCDSPTAG